MITADQLIAHAIGDYVLQSHWMATEKTKRWLPCLIHVYFYGFVFQAAFNPSMKAMILIMGSHYLIDRYRLARYVVISKNVLFCPQGSPHELAETYNSDTGFPIDTPPWLSFWLLIIVDNVTHILINGLALKYL